MKRHVFLAVGIVGLAELVAPNLAVRLGTRIAYRDAEAAEPRDWVQRAARIEGALLVALALGGLHRIAGGDPIDGNDG